MNKTRFYKGYEYYKLKGNWVCNYFAIPENHPFKTITEIKYFINDMLENQ